MTNTKTTQDNRHFAVINSTDGSFHIHKHDCADIARRDAARANGPVETVQAPDADAVRAAIVDDLRGDFGDDAEHFGFTIYPCAR